MIFLFFNLFGPKTVVERTDIIRSTVDSRFKALEKITFENLE